MIHSIEEKIDITKISYDFLIIGFPKYYEYPVMIMLQYLKRNLPNRKKPVPSLAFCTQAGPLPTDFTGLEKVLKMKNHMLTVEASFPYANNMMIFKAFPPTEQVKINENIDNMRNRIKPLCDIFLNKKISKEHTKTWQKPLIYAVASACTKLMPVFAMRFSTDENCIHCGLCAKRCPVQNISMVSGKPVFSKHCLFCMRCINYCPVNAIRYNGKKCQQYICDPHSQSAKNKLS